MTAAARNILVVGIGSAHGDDQVGWRIADGLRTEADVAVRTASVPMKLLDWLDEVSELHVIDACEADGAPGDLLRIEWPGDFPSGNSPQCRGSHDFDVAAVLKLAERLGRLPEDVTVWAIVGRHFDQGQPLSSAVAAKLPGCVDLIRKELTNARTFAGPVTTESS